MNQCPLLEALTPYADSATPAARSRTPSTGVRADGGRSPRRPASTATTSCRDAMCAGTTAASTADSSPKAATTATIRQSTSSGPNHSPDQRWASGSSAHPTTTPSTAPDEGGQRAEHDPGREHHPAGLPRRAAGRGHQGQRAGLAPGTDGERRPGQQHHLEQRHGDDQGDDRERVAVPGVVAHLLGHLVHRRRVGQHRARGHDHAGPVEGEHVGPHHRVAVDEPVDVGACSRRSRAPARPGSTSIVAVSRTVAWTPGADHLEVAVADGHGVAQPDPALDQHVVDHGLVGRLRRPAGGDLEEPGGERVAQVDLAGGDAHPPVPQRDLGPALAQRDGPDVGPSTAVTASYDGWSAPPSPSVPHPPAP